jgi:hypothetical protein
MGIRWPLLVRRTHKWLALFVGIQALIWTATGMYMVAVHIDYIHGDHLVRASKPVSQNLAALAPPTPILAAHPNAREVRLSSLFDRPVWKATTPDGTQLFDARTGAAIAPLTKAQIEAAARTIYTGDPTIVATKLLTVAPLEMQTRKPPFWQVEFEGWNRPTLYLSPTTGELISRRHTLWRVFDFAWMLHIMDYSERTNVNNPLLRVATWSAVLMALAGALLLVWSFPKKKKKKVA